MAPPAPRANRRASRWQIGVTAALAYTMAVASLAQDVAVRSWLDSYGEIERSGPAAAFGIAQAALIERSSLVASDPSATLPSGVPDPSAAEALILSDLGHEGWGDSTIFARFGDPRNRSLDWDGPDARESIWLRASAGYVSGRYLVVSLRGGPEDCTRFLGNLSPYALSRARGAWSMRRVPYGRAELAGISWGAPGDAAGSCRESPHAALRWFLLRFDLAKTQVPGPDAVMTR